jgi:hypothetical protein
MVVRKVQKDLCNITPPCPHLSRQSITLILFTVIRPALGLDVCPPDQRIHVPLSGPGRHLSNSLYPGNTIFRETFETQFIQVRSDLLIEGTRKGSNGLRP